MSEEALKAARDGLHVRVPASLADAAALRAEVRAADAALGAWLRSVGAGRAARADLRDEAAAR
ncbi:hypothetical protein ACTJI8_09530 [Microbacterium sp. 22303]|uniref:hypothetical protein n=1 Tax=Microbacterium sp. 22303 TaxID=3453905 RepID=UPI003F83E0F7